LTPGLPSTLRQKVRALVTERLNAAALRRCDLAFITQDGYRSLLTSEKTEIVKTAPSWLDDEWLVSAAEADELAEQRLEEPRLRVLFAGRVEREKGIEILLRASAKVGSDAMALTVLGDGSAREAMVALAEELGCAVSWADPVPYGQPFLAQLRAADLLVVPSLSDEQPRVVFDAMSQGLVVLASSTRGLTDVLDADTSLLVKSGDVGELSDSLRWASEHKDECVHMGRLSRDRVTSWTHSGAHRVRYAAFEALLGGSARPQR
jgi:glycosyltransferase involved in cell wall biosynthesis